MNFGFRADNLARHIGWFVVIIGVILLYSDLVVSHVYCNLGMLSLDKVIVPNVQNHDDRKHIGLLLWRSDADFRTPIRFFRRSLHWDPGRATAYRGLGEIEVWQDDPISALPLLQRWNALNTTKSSYMELGNLHQINGNWQQAINYWQKGGFQRVAKVLSDGTVLVLDDFANPDLWHRHAATSVVNSFFVSIEDDTVLFSSINNYDNRDSAIYERPFDVFVEGYSNLELKLKIEDRSYFTLETLVDGNWIRLMDYYQGDGSWEIVSLPINGTLLEAVRISLSEPHQDVKMTQVYRVQLEYLKACEKGVPCCSCVQ